MSRLAGAATRRAGLPPATLTPVVQIAVTQSISGTGALRIGAAFVSRFYPHSKAVYMPAPTWGNHIPIAKDSGLEVKTYSYYDKKTVGLDFEGFKADLRVRAAHCRPAAARVLRRSFTGRAGQVRLPRARVRAQPDRSRPDQGAVEGALGHLQGEGAPPVVRHGLPGLCLGQRRRRRVRPALLCRAGPPDHALPVVRQVDGTLRRCAAPACRAGSDVRDEADRSRVNFQSVSERSPSCAPRPRRRPRSTLRSRCELLGRPASRQAGADDTLRLRTASFAPCTPTPRSTAPASSRPSFPTPSSTRSGAFPPSCTV